MVEQPEDDIFVGLEIKKGKVTHCLFMRWKLSLRGSQILPLNNPLNIRLQIIIRLLGINCDLSLLKNHLKSLIQINDLQPNGNMQTDFIMHINYIEYQKPEPVTEFG